MKKEQLTDRQNRSRAILCIVLAVGMLFAGQARAFVVNVVGSDAGTVGDFRWLLEEDNTNVTVPGVPVRVSIGTAAENERFLTVLRQVLDETAPA